MNVVAKTCFNFPFFSKNEVNSKSKDLRRRWITKNFRILGIAMDSEILLNTANTNKMYLAVHGMMDVVSG